MKKKVAVQLSGYLRTINECIDSWSNILDYDKYDYDFFIHTYKNYGFSKGFHVDDIEDDDLISLDNLKSKINIKQIVVEEHTKQGSQILPSGHNKDRVKSMFRKIYLCNHMCQDYCEINNENYDFFIRMRPDIFFTKKINLSNIEKHTIYVHKFAWDGVVVNGVINDQFAICSKDTINKYCSLFNLYDKYSSLSPEKAVFEYLKDEEVTVEYLDFGFEIKRGK